MASAKLLFAILWFMMNSEMGLCMTTDQILESMSSAFADSGYGVEEDFLNYVGGNPSAVREAIHDHLKLADKKEAEHAVGHLAIAAAAILYCLVASRIGPKTW
eukprot:4930673-Amphidinium_carterae.1